MKDDSLECVLENIQVNRQGFLQGITQEEMQENWKEPTNEGFLDFFKCAILCV